MRAITVRAAAALCSVSPGTIRRWADEGIIPSYRLPSGHRRFPPLKVIQFARKLVDGQPGGNDN